MVRKNPVAVGCSEEPLATCFAQAERLDDASLVADIAFATENPVITGFLKTASGLLAVLNEYRQILAVNEVFLKALGVREPAKVLGLRPGEVIQCVHARDMAAGCGTGKFCATCGAAIAIVSALASDTPEERKCIVTVGQDGQTTDLCFKVRACAVTVGERRLVLLFLQDITAWHRWGTLERAFFHDISNLITAILTNAELMMMEDEGDTRELARRIYELADRLAGEVKTQRVLLRQEDIDYPLRHEEVALNQIAQQIRDLFANHPLAKNKTLRLPEAFPARSIVVDLSLLLRILMNMVTNALEASDEGEEVRLWVEQDDAGTAFYVWNRRFIPENVALRVFQRYFSTKQEVGRGLGTYAIKLFGEQFLGGKVDFTTSESDGTTFRFHLPA
jgi:K+-sensing histidine kinase KdpD